MIKYLTIISFIVTIVAFWNRNDLSGDIQFSPKLQAEPIQIPNKREPFPVTVNNNRYTIKPLYDYELYGLVVSYQHHDGDYGLHRLWKDHLNIADICVVWQETAFSEHLHKLDFWNGQFTCNVSTRDQAAWESFRMHQLSNNHLITDDAYLREKISDVSIGDQIMIKGWLASYNGENGGGRGTSTTRSDTGNGACETIYVTEFEVVSHYTNIWRKLMYVGLIVFIGSVIFYFSRPFKVNS